MWTRRRLVLLVVLFALWITFVVFGLLNGWHGYYVAIGFVMTVAGQLIIPRETRPAGDDRGPQGPWPDKALIPELIRRRRAPREP